MARSEASKGLRPNAYTSGPMYNISKKHKSPETVNIAMDSVKVLTIVSLAVLVGAIVAIIVISGMDDDGPSEPPKPQPPSQKSAKWADFHARTEVRTAWRSDAYLTYVEWLNCNATGVMSSSDAMTLYYASNESANYYRITVNFTGVTTFLRGEVAKTAVFKVGGGDLEAWSADSHDVLPKASNYFLKPDDEYVYRFYVQPANTIEKDLNTTHPVVRVQTQHQTMYFDGVSGEFITRFSAIL